MKAMCEVCGKKFKNPFALTGHYKMKDDAPHRAWREKNIKSNVQPKTQKSAVQHGPYSPDVLEKAQELVEKEAKDKIINEYFKNIIMPLFDNGTWLDFNKHQSILAKKDEDHQLEISSIEASHQIEKENLENQIYNQSVEINFLKDENFRLSNYIDNRFDGEVGRWRKELTHKQEDFARYKEAELSNLNKLKAEIDKKQKDVELRENIIAEREEDIIKREDDFEKNKKTYDCILKEKIKIIKKREENVTESEKELIRVVDKKKNELNNERKKIKEYHEKWESEIKYKVDKQIEEIKNDQEKIINEWEKIDKVKEEQKAESKRLENLQKKLRGAWCSNKFLLPCPNCKDPMLFDTNNPEINQKIRKIFGNYTHPECRTRYEQKKPVILSPFLSSGEPNVQSGVQPIVISDEKVNVAENSGDPVYQSGFTRFYASGMENFDKTSSKSNAFSS
ncbi:MAG: hypothetical protein JSW06_04665 [Thermoplasmatales archaeon]|nr:MAG: hypothetical protein JSW06_04665 [Thermoplasmatales archaeon]